MSPLSADLSPLKNTHEAGPLTPSSHPGGHPKTVLLDRDHSLLAFNERVLSWAADHQVPLLERLRYLCIVSSNLDEFFEVRAEPHISAVLLEEAKGPYTASTFQLFAQKAAALVAKQYVIYNDHLQSELSARGVKILTHAERNAVQKKWVKSYFEREVRPLLLPIGLDPSHPFPQVANKSLNFIVRLKGNDAFGRDNEIAIVKVPRVLPRVIRLPQREGSQHQHFVLLSSVIRSHLADLFPGRQVTEFSQFRVTRHSDLAVDEDEVRNLRTALRKELAQRNYGQAVRLEVSSDCAPFLSDFLLKQFNLPEGAMYRVPGPVNLVRLTQLIDLVNDRSLLFPPFKSSFPKQLQQGVSLFEQLALGDVAIHQPFESFDGVMAFLREAVNDPKVLAIKQTVYRTGSDSEMMNLLREAVRRGKEVTVVVELKARFDEEANINWAEALETVGAQVVYGVVGLKTHAKMLLVTRREGRQLRRYGHLSTGNYNPNTAKLYTDISYLTAQPALTADMDAVFSHLASQSRMPKLKQLIMAPTQLQKRMIDLIDQAGHAANRPEGARIVAKMNTLTDEPLIRALLAAGQRGVKIDLIVRGACTLPAGVPGVSDNIRVRSIIGRFLEHSRVFYFRMGKEEHLYLSSADWMNRNMLRRIELAWPVTEPKLRQRLIDECLVAYLLDDRDAWELQGNGRYEKMKPSSLPAKSAQEALMRKFGSLGHCH